MIRKLIGTDNDLATTILRLVLGVIFFVHGAQKLLGWFGGFGFSGTMGYFIRVMHFAAVFAFLGFAAVIFGGMGLRFWGLSRGSSMGIYLDKVTASLLGVL